MRTRISFDILDDEKAVDISQNLAAITENSPHVTLSVSSELTVRGAQAIAQGLKQSQIEQLCIIPRTDIMLRAPTTHESILQPIVEAAIQHIPDLKLYFRFGRCDDLATMLSGILLRVDAQANHHALHTLKFDFLDMTEVSAQQLGVGLRHAKIKCLELGVGLSREVMSTVYPAAMQTAEHLTLRIILNNETAIEFGDALIGNTNLQSFKFELDSRLSINAAERLANGISHSRIVHLGLNGYVSADVKDTLHKLVARSPTICHLYLGSKFDGTPGLVQCLPKLCTLEIRLAMVSEMPPILMMGLRHAPHLTSLVFAGRCFLEECDVVTICASLPYLTCLTNIQLRCTLACDERPDRFVAPRAFEFRRIQATLTEQIMVAVTNHPSLVCLTLKNCLDIGFSGLEMIGMHLPNTKLSV